MNDIRIYVYGSCHFSERLDSDEVVGNGGWGVVIESNGKCIDEISGGFARTTNARMDIIGITEGLKRIKDAGSITVYLTNGYVVDTLTKGWLPKWKQTGFQKKKHADLWLSLDKVLEEIAQKVDFKHSRAVKNSLPFTRAGQLAKNMSGKVNLPIDSTETDSLFQTANQLLPGTEQAQELADDKPIHESVCVDASSTGNPGRMEYRGVDTKTGTVVFEMKYDEATNNIGEFLAIVHAIALYKRQGKELKIVYSDSLTAISWVRQKTCKTKLVKTPQNAIVFEHVERAIKWLENNTYATKVLKWNTGAWGEIPADYGRK